MQRFWPEMPLKTNLIKHQKVSVLDETKNNGFFSGNKIRKLSFLDSLSDLKGILSFGSKYSNHCVACAYYAWKINIPCILLILDNSSDELDAFPNVRLSKSLGAKTVHISIQEAYEKIEAYKINYSEYFFIPGGGHITQGFNAYHDLGLELLKEDSLKSIEWILLPYGTGTTASGFLKAIGDKNIKIIGVSVAREKSKCLDALSEYITEEDLSNLVIVDQFSSDYGITYDSDAELTKKFFGDYGIIVDPIYNIRSIRYFYENNLQTSHGLIIVTGGLGNMYL